MNEKTSNGTSGQNVPKSKFRHKSRQEQAAESKLLQVCAERAVSLWVARRNSFA